MQGVSLGNTFCQLGEWGDGDDALHQGMGFVNSLNHDYSDLAFGIKFFFVLPDTLLFIFF